MLDPIVPVDAPPKGTIALGYQRETSRYWVYGRTASPDGSLPDVLATVHYRKRAASPPPCLYMALTEAPPSAVQGGRLIDPED